MEKLDLIQQLCTCAGMIMEDASVEAIAIVSPEASVRRERLGQLRQAASDIDAVIAAAEVLDRRLED